MEREELNLNRESNNNGLGGNNSKGGGGDGFIDRSKVRILLCDNDSKSSEEVFTLLIRCSYQVVSVKSARQVIDALNAERQYIDIILAEVDLPIKKGMKMLKYIARDKELRRIPVIMMSAQDEVSIVVKCLKLGAADYLVKPLRTNELLNLWTHMWRRRRMLGLVENNILNYDFDLVASDPSDANTNSTTLFSDDTDDESKRSSNPEAGISTQQEAAVAMDIVIVEEHPNSSVSPDVPGISDRRTGAQGQHQSCNNITDGYFSSAPKKSELRIGESSAFFTYVKATTTMRSNIEEIVHIHKNATKQVRMEDMDQACAQERGNLQRHENGETLESHSQEDLPSSNSIPDSFSIERSCTPPASTEVSQQKNYKEEHRQGVVHPRNGSHGSEPDASGMNAHHAYPYYMSGVVNHPGQIPANHSWPQLGGSSSSEVKLSKVDRREAALMKFRQKRKERCFDKKIRYVNRKRLAERRPRVRGQFVRKVNGVNVDLNGQPASTDYDDEDDEEEEEDNNVGNDSSPEDS
ncbi:Tor complex Tor2 interacting protein 1 [Stylosanthes scabra]|uniref:Tor complex Tor2 interacting protein 1 n=1 Tax=Stylosanthes scabra TaxID=79078 RepID=A0ABU6WAM0_9FABA|nr:Tor complex Tor2 interacting protein 1 [Stylosanthes scabra]